MNTHLRFLLPLALLAGAAACSTAEGGNGGMSGSSHSAMSEEEMMAKMMELAVVGPEHQELASRAGTWTEHYRWRMSPDQPWTEADGTSEGKMIMGGRYLMQNVKMTLEGMPMEGMQIMGYDNMHHEYIALWMDSMSTWWVTSSGKKDSAGALHMSGMMVDMAGERPYRMVMRPQPDGSEVSEMYDTIDGKEVLMMEITARKK